MIWKASEFSSVLISFAFAALWLQRKGTAEQRRLTCSCTLIVCAIVWTAAAFPSSWLPATLPNAVPSIQAAIDQGSMPAVKDVLPSSASETAHALVSRATSVAVGSEFDWNALYALGVGLSLLIWLGGWVHSLRLVRTGRNDSDLQSKSNMRTCLVPRLKTPLCLGWPYRCILLPVEAVEWDASTLEMVMRHEETHIQRQDHAWIHLAHLLCIVQWFNPLAWLLARRLRIECEQVADNSVLGLGVAPSRYAEVLLAFQTSKPSLFSLSAAQPIYRQSGFAKRLESILSPATKRNTMNKKSAITIATVVVLGCGAVATFTFARAKQHFAPSFWLTGAHDSRLPHQEYYERREAEVGQIGMMVQGKPVVWDIHGNIIPSDQIIDHKWQPDRQFALTAVQSKRHMNPHAQYGHIVFRVKARPDDGVPGAVAEIQPEPSENNPGWGTDLPTQYLKTEHSWHYFVSPHAVFPTAFKEATNRKDIALFGHGQATGNWRITLAKPIDEGSIDKLPLFSKWTAEPAGKSQDQFEEDRAKRHNSPAWTMVRFTRPTMVSHKIHFFRKDGSEIPDSLVSGEYVEKPAKNHYIEVFYFVGVPTTEIGDVRVTTRKSVGIVFSGILMSPNGGPSA